MMRKLKGVTLIEVTLVLAIAGAIMVMVFVGVPALTATQRDAARKDHMMLFISQLKSYQANNNRGALPVTRFGLYLREAEWVQGKDVTFGEEENTGTSWKDFYGGYLGESFVDPDGTRYDLMIMECTTKDVNGANANSVGSNCTNKRLEDISFHNIYVLLNATCKGIDAVYSSNPRNVAIIYKMERSDRYCANT